MRHKVILKLHRQFFRAGMTTLVVFLTLALASIGCGGSRHTAAPTPTPTPVPTPTPNPTPAVSAVSPNAAPAGALAFTLTVNGSNFLSSSQVQWNGSSRATTFINSGQLQAHIMAADLAAAGKTQVTVVNPSPGGGNSNAATFTIAPATIAFDSLKDLTGIDAANAVNNIWVMNPDGSGQTALTKSGNAVSASPVWSNDGSKIAFISMQPVDGTANPAASFNIWSINPDGSGPTPLTKHNTTSLNSFSPVWSPDGSKIAFTSRADINGTEAVNQNNTRNIWIMNPDGSGVAPLTKLTVNGASSGPSVWSPDGSKIAYSSFRNLDGTTTSPAVSSPNVWIMNADGSGSTPLTHFTGDGPAWSPSGAKIAFLSLRATDGSNTIGTVINVWSMNADGSGAVPLTKLTTQGLIVGAFPAWSPDGSKIAFLSKQDVGGADALNLNSTTNVWVMNADGSSASPLTKLTAAQADAISGLGASVTALIWSPDGRKIFFASRRNLDGSNTAGPNATANLWAINADGTNPTPLTNATAKGADSGEASIP